MVTFPLNLVLAPIPTNSGMDANTFAQTIVANLSATVSGNILTGQTGGAQPTSNVGPWFDGTQWWFWNNTLQSYQTEFSFLQQSQFGLSQPDYNSLINGDSQVWQRQTSTASVGASTGYFGPDRWKYTGSMTSGLATVSRQLSGITGGQFTNTTNANIEYCTRITVTTPQASLNAGDHFELSQTIEQQLARPLFNVSTSLGIALRSTVTGTYCVSIADQALGQSWVAECAIASANTWTFYPFPAIPVFPSASNLGSTDTGASYLVRVCAAAGSTFNAGSNGLWSAGNNVADSKQTNLFATNGNFLDFTLVKHQPGTAVTPFAPVPFDTQLLRCMRYYRKSYQYTDFAGTTTTAGSFNALTASVGSVILTFTVQYDPEMRTNATPTLYSPNTGTANRIYVVGVGDSTTSGAPGTVSTKGFANQNATGNFSTSAIAEFHYVTDADF